MQSSPTIVEFSNAKQDARVLPKLAFYYDDKGSVGIREEGLTDSQTRELLALARCYCDKRLVEELAKVTSAQFTKVIRG